MSAQDYWNSNQSNSRQDYSQQSSGQGQDGYPSPYSQQQSHDSYQQPNQHQGNERLNWGYGGDSQPTSTPHGQSYYQSHSPAPYEGQQYAQDQNQGYGYQQHQAHNPYNDGRHSPQSPVYGSSTDYNRQASPNPYQTGHGQYPDQGFSSHGGQPYPGATGPGGQDGDRGLLGALAGGAAGGFAGHKVNHGFLGAVGGAYAGHKLEDHYKDKKKEKKHRHGRRDSSSSSSSSSSDEEKKKHKHHGKYGAAAAGGVGAAAYGHQQHHQEPALAGNFSASSTQISLDRDFDLIASCSMVNGQQRLSSIDLNGCLTNSWGQFQWARGGGFGASARNVRLVDGGRVLEAELGNGQGGWNRSHIRLDERITNNDGDLQFLG